MELGKRDSEERMWFVRYWANYMKTHTNEDWSKQQAFLINSVLKTVDTNPKLYLKVKEITESANK